MHPEHFVSLDTGKLPVIFISSFVLSLRNYEMGIKEESIVHVSVFPQPFVWDCQNNVTKRYQLKSPLYSLTVFILLLISSIDFVFMINSLTQQMFIEDF